MHMQAAYVDSVGDGERERDRHTWKREGEKRRALRKLEKTSLEQDRRGSRME